MRVESQTRKASPSVRASRLSSGGDCATPKTRRRKRERKMTWQRRSKRCDSRGSYTRHRYCKVAVWVSVKFAWINLKSCVRGEDSAGTELIFPKLVTSLCSVVQSGRRTAVETGPRPMVTSTSRCNQPPNRKQIGSRMIPKKRRAPREVD